MGHPVVHYGTPCSEAVVKVGALLPCIGINLSGPRIPASQWLPSFRGEFSSLTSHMLHITSTISFQKTASSHRNKRSYTYLQFALFTISYLKTLTLHPCPVAGDRRLLCSVPASWWPALTGAGQGAGWLRLFSSDLSLPFTISGLGSVSPGIRVMIPDI